MKKIWQKVDFSELSQNALYALLRLRQEVFVVEQNCVYQDVDGLDQQAIHILCWRDGQLLAYLRCLPPGVSYPDSALGRIVVSPEGRGLQLGRDLVERGIEQNLERWPDSDIRINAQAYLRKFYASLGFKVVGDQYDEDGIPHVQMLYVRPRAET